MYGSDLGDRLFPLVRHGVPLVPPALLRLWGPLWRRCPTRWRPCSTMGERADPEDMDGYFQHMARLDPLVLVKVAEGMHRHSAADVLPDDRCRPWWWPAGASPWTPPALARHGKAMPDAELRAGEAGHSLPIEEPSALEALVLGWLAERFPPRAGGARPHSRAPLDRLGGCATRPGPTPDPRPGGPAGRRPGPGRGRGGGARLRAGVGGRAGRAGRPSGHGRPGAAPTTAPGASAGAEPVAYRLEPAGGAARTVRLEVAADPAARAKG